jgi:hypothetical protein
VSAQDAIERSEGSDWEFPEPGVAATMTGLTLVWVAAPDFADECWTIHCGEDESWAVETDELLDVLPAALHPWIAVQLDRLVVEAFTGAAQNWWEEEEADEDGQAAAEYAAELKQFYGTIAAFERDHAGLRSDRFDPDGATDVDGRRHQLDAFSQDSLGRQLTDAERLDCAALGLTKALHRNSPLEDAHVERVDDADMFRGNVATYRAIRSALNDPGPWPAIAALLSDPRRRMPDGRSFSQWLGSERAEFDELIEKWVAHTTEKTERIGDGPTLDRWALAGLLGCADWFGHPRWPERVARFQAVLAAGEFHDRPLPERPDGLTDERLFVCLAEDPSRLTAEQAGWCIAAGLGFV